MWNLYLESNYHFQLTVDHGRMDRIVNLMLQVFFPVIALSVAIIL